MAIAQETFEQLRTAGLAESTPRSPTRSAASSSGSAGRSS